jgi:hypothetical protein
LIWLEIMGFLGSGSTAVEGLITALDWGQLWRDCGAPWQPVARLFPARRVPPVSWFFVTAMSGKYQFAADGEIGWSVIVNRCPTWISWGEIDSTPTAV